MTDLDLDLQYEQPTPRNRRLLAVLSLLGVLGLLLMPFVARAQDIPAAPVGVPGVPSVEDAPLQFAALLVQLGQQGKWGPLVALIVFALVFALRKFASKLPDGSVKVFLLGKWGGWLLNLGVALSAGIAGLLLSPVTVSVASVVGVVMSAVMLSLSAAGLVELKKDATAKGEAAAAAVDTKAEALGVLEKGPPAP